MLSLRVISGFAADTRMATLLEDVRSPRSGSSRRPADPARAPETFSIAEARAIVQDLFDHKPSVYWLDFFASLTIGYACATAYFAAPLFSGLQILCFVVAVLALHRLSNFMHEVVHFRGSEMRGFRNTWNLLAGVPMLTPSFFYEPHIAHHNTNHYGTAGDGEYIPLARRPLRNILYFFCQVFVQPLIYVVRFGVLTPISFLHPRLRQWVLERASTFGIVWTYRRSIPADAPRATWAMVELLCCIRTIAIFALVFLGLNPWYRIPQLYVLAVFILSLTYLRTSVAHRFRNDGRKMTHLEQLFDSIDITGVPVLTELLFPLGLRYHALHHLFPGIPYHNLGVAHRRLMAELPPDSPYRQVVYPTFSSAFRDLVKESYGSSRKTAT